MKKSELKLLIEKIIRESAIFENTQDPTKEEMFNYLKTMYGNEDGFADNAEVAIYWFASFYHGGQSSNLYSALSTSRFYLGAIAKGPEEGSLEEMMYDDLVLKFSGDRKERGRIERKRSSLNEAYEHEGVIKKQIYSELEKVGFQKNGSTPRDYMEYYISGFATVSCIVNIMERYIFFDRYYDNERVDSMPGYHIEKKVKLTEDPQKNERLARQVTDTVLKLKKSIDGDESILGGIDDISEGITFDK